MRHPLRANVYLALALLAVVSQALAVEQIEPTVSFQGRPIRFANREHPYYLGSSAMVPIRTVCQAIGAGVRESRDSKQWTILRGADRIDCSPGTPWFTFNGVRQTLQEPPEARDRNLFVPLSMLQAISGSGLEIKAIYGSSRETSIFYLNRLLHYKPEDAPFHQFGTVYVSVRATAGFIGAKVDTRGEGARLTITRSRDKLVYELSSHWFSFNDAQRALRAESIIRGKTVFVPIEIFQAFLGQELCSR